jgi:hypothetical protein
VARTYDSGTVIASEHGELQPKIMEQFLSTVMLTG